MREILNFKGLEMEFGRFGEVDPDILWAEVEKLNSRTTPSLLNTQNDGPHEVNPSRNLESSIVDPLQTQHIEGLRNELAATTPTLVQDSVGAVIVATNQTQNTAPRFNFAEAAASSSRGNPPAPRLIVEDHRNQLPQLSPHSSAPSMNVTQSNYPSPSVVGLIHGGAVSSTQGQDMTPMSYYNQFSHMQNNMIHDLGPHNQHSTSSQLLVPNILVNNNHNGINNQYSSYPTLFQQNPVAAGAGINTGITNEQFMTNQRSPSFPVQNDQAINSRTARNSPWSLAVPNQRNENIPLLGSSTLYGTTAPPSGLTNSSALNSVVLALSNTDGTSSGSSETSRLLRPERVSGTQLHEVVPVSSANLVIAQSANGLPQSSSARAASSGVLQNTSLNLQNERQGQQEPLRLGGAPKRYEAGGTSSSSRRQTTVSTGTQNAGIAQEVLNANPINPFPAPNPRQVFNAVYDPTYQSIGLPVDPHLRLFKQLKEK